MRNTLRTAGTFLATVLLLNAIHNAQGDEGMWLFNDPPLQILKERYQFEPDASWLEHLQKSSIRFDNGGSGSFVSANGLILTNHHIGFDTLQKLSDAKHNYVKDGFLARTQAEEKPALDLELNVLMSIEDVTTRVNAVIKPGMTPEKAYQARRAVMADIEKESQDKTGLRSDVIELYGGAKFHLYRYKRYTDVRLVFAPEQQAAFFGGDPDNFEYPRYNLDVCFFRAYENGAPAKIEHYLKWSTQGVAENELVFVSGNPGHSNRQFTTAQLESMRDKQIPRSLQRLYRKEDLLTSWGARGDENERRVKKDLFSIANSRKALLGRLAGLMDPEFLSQKAHAEDELRKAAEANPAYTGLKDAWAQIQTSQQKLDQQVVPISLLEWGKGFDTPLFEIARTLVRHADEKIKPNGQRLPEFRDSNRDSLELGLFSDAPIYNDLETLKLSDALTWLTIEYGGPGNPIVKQLLAGKSPHERAVELISGTRLADVAFRKKLYALSPEEIAATHDPMIELARTIDSEARRLRKYEEEQAEVQTQAYGKINAARFALEKTHSYPDATFTLRLAFGTARGYQQDGENIPYETTIAGFYQRAEQHHNQPPFDLPSRWFARKDRLNLSTPFNFVSTADIIGGNSGSPVVNRAGEFVGIIFDGNIQSLVVGFAYSDKQSRAVSVCSQGIVEALKNVYDATELTDELLGNVAAPNQMTRVR